MFEIRTKKSKIILQIVLLLMTLPYLLPLVQMVIGSLGGTGLANYVAVWDTGVVPTYFRNSLIVAVSVIALVEVLCMVAGFGFSKLHIRGKEFFFWAILVALTLPEVILLTPLILLTRNFDDGIPNELMEAARIDGANIWQTFIRIVLPLTKPIASAILVLTLISAWNSYLMPLVFLQTPDLQVVTLLPQYFQGEFTNDQTKILAAAVMTAVPEILAYLLMQKNFEKGMSAGALK